MCPPPPSNTVDEESPPVETHSTHNENPHAELSNTTTTTTATKPFPRVVVYFGLLCLVDVCLTVLGYRFGTRVDSHHILALQLNDTLYACALRVMACVVAFTLVYWMPRLGLLSPQQEDNLFHPNGDRKTRDELAQEMLELPWRTYLGRVVQRPAVWAAMICTMTPILTVIQALTRLSLEMGTWHDTQPFHVMYWWALLWAAIASTIQACGVGSVCTNLADYVKEKRQLSSVSRTTTSSSLLEPLLPAQQQQNEEEQENDDTTPSPDDVRAVPDISGDTDYKATYEDLLRLCQPDVHLLVLAFGFLLLAAICQALIPKYLGQILDCLNGAFDSGNNNNNNSTWTYVLSNDDDDDDIMDIPHFCHYMKLLVTVSIGAGIFSGLRGSIFTVVGANVNVRLRLALMDSLLVQDQGFFDVVKTGDITSRLSSDTTLVGDQVTLNVNVFLRSLVQAVCTLGFMVHISWQLTLLAFLTIPVITLLSRTYGSFVRRLAKVMQTKLADGNAISEAVLSNMTTVRAFDAASLELSEFQKCMTQYLQLNVRSAVAYFGYATLTTSLPELVFAVVIFYGGLLVRNGSLQPGNLVSFLLYLQSLSDSIASLGWVFSALMQAVGAADKVFELLNRQPKITPPTSNGDATAPAGPNGTEMYRSEQQRTRGVIPPEVRGEITLSNVTLYYPARPQRRVLHDLNLTIPAGSIVALVGQSGGGKSSVMSLIQHQYEPQEGQVLLDGIPVHELSPSWLSQTVSIVAQEPTLFARSIRQNIMYGLEGTAMEPTQEDLEEAARLANAHDFICQMPQGYDTQVGERGVQLSGGQKQRLAIARALVRKPKVLLCTYLVWIRFPITLTHFLQWTKPLRLWMPNRNITSNKPLTTCWPKDRA